MITQLKFTDQAGAQPSAPLFADRISFLGEASYPTGGTLLFQTAFNAITRDGRKPLAIVAQDCAGYVPVLSEGPGSALSGAGSFDITAGMDLQLQLDGDPEVFRYVFQATDFATSGAATAAEVADALNDFFETEEINAVASVTSVTHVTITSGTVGENSAVTIVGGTAETAFTFVSTQGGDSLKIYQGNGVGALEEVPAATNLSAVTFNVVVLSK